MYIISFSKKTRWFPFLKTLESECALLIWFLLCQSSWGTADQEWWNSRHRNLLSDRQAHHWSHIITTDFWGMNIHKLPLQTASRQKIRWFGGWSLGWSIRFSWMTQSEILDLFRLKFGDLETDIAVCIHKWWLSLDGTFQPHHYLRQLTTGSTEQGKSCANRFASMKAKMFFHNVSDEENFPHEFGNLVIL